MRQKHYGIGVLGFGLGLLGAVSGWSADSAKTAAPAAPAAAAVPSADEDAGWVKYGEEQGVTLWKKKIEGSKYVAFRGEGLIESTPIRIISAMANVERRLEWVSDCTDAKAIEVKSKIDKIDYNRTHTPWPLQDRDFVYRTQIDLSREKGEIFVRLNSVEDGRMPAVKGVVRGAINHSYYIMRAQPDGKTWVRVEMHADPKGAIPAWAVNLVQKKWPLVTLVGLRKEAARDDVKVDPELSLYWEKGVVPSWYHR